MQTWGRNPGTSGAAPIYIANRKSDQMKYVLPNEISAEYHHDCIKTSGLVTPKYVFFRTNEFGKSNHSCPQTPVAP